MNAIHKALTFVFPLVVAVTPLAAAEWDAKITPREAWSTFFASDEVTLGYTVDSRKSTGVRVAWAFSAQRRTIARGEMSRKVEPIEIALRLPPLREGVTLDTELHVQLIDDRGGVVADHRRVLRIFGRDAFAHRREWLTGLKLVLFDTQKKTQETFDDAGIPYKLARNAAALRETTDGLVVIGEGVSFANHPSLPETLTDLAAKGVSVLCLAPADGHLAFPGAEDGRPKPECVSFRGSEIITELDKRLDARAWPPSGGMVASTVEVTSRRGRVVLSVSDTPRAWPWLEVTYTGQRQKNSDLPDSGRLIVCGFGLIDNWQASPTPRYLLMHILVRLSQEAAEPPHNSSEQE